MPKNSTSFKKGENGGARGGARPGAGRPPDGLREMVKDIVSKKKLVERLADIASGEDIPQPINNGEVISIPAPVSEQRRSIVDLIEIGHGKPGQDITVNDSGGSEISESVVAPEIRFLAQILAGAIGSGDKESR